MESMDNFRERFEALEQRTEQLQQHTRTVKRWRRWWRSMVLLGGVLGLCHAGYAANFACAAGDVACLIAAVNAANTNGQVNTITLAAGTYTLTAVDNTTDGPNG